MADKITELYIMLESRMKTLHEAKKIPDRFYNNYVCVCKAHNKCIQEQSVFHKYMMGIRPENVTTAKEMPEDILKVLRKSFPQLDEADIAGADLANLVICAYNGCCQYGKALANRLSQLYRQASLGDSRLAEILEDFEEAMREMNAQAQQTE